MHFSLRVLIASSFLWTLTVPSPGFAATSTNAILSDVTIPTEALRAVVIVGCDDRQGSGTIINGDPGYILTNAHVLANIETQRPAQACDIGILDQTNKEPRYWYKAIPEKWVFNPARNQDFAILKITSQQGDAGIPKPFPFLKTNEFATVSSTLHLLGYSIPGKETLSIRHGSILGFQKGFIQTDAPIRTGDSGGTALDEQFHLLGAPTRIVTFSDGNTENHTYEIVDVRAVFNWLDTFGPNTHDQYFTHADSARYHEQANFLSSEQLGCLFVVRTLVSSTVHCLLPNDQRWVFPNEETFLSWYPDFNSVLFIDLDSIAPFQIVRNSTFKPGTLIKTRSLSNVYVVVDAFGTIRWIPTEERAKQLWGANWAGLVRDVPDEFFINYSKGQPLE